MSKILKKFLMFGFVAKKKDFAKTDQGSWGHTIHQG
jgi:hypothetical protein